MSTQTSDWPSSAEEHRERSIVRMLGNHLLVRRLPQVQIGVIVLPSAFDDDNNTGGPKLYRVLATGPGRRNRKGVLIPIECAPGDRIICHSYTAGVADVKLTDGQFILTADQILLVLPKIAV